MNSTETPGLLTFPIKLKKIVDSPESDHLIYWAEDGLSFHIADENRFARDVIPNYFKHSNISSFIRQLNMYGFHKVNKVDNGLSIIGTGNDDSQWVHPNFVRDKPELLSGVLRKVIQSNSSSEIVPYDSVKGDISRLAKMVQYLRKRDEETTERLKALKAENDELYSEFMFLREQHTKQTKCIEMLIDFISKCTQTQNTLTQGFKTKRNILALDAPKYKHVNPQRDDNEPPRKYQVTSLPQISCSNTPNNNMIPARKIIKIKNINQQPTHIDIKAPKIMSTLNKDGLYSIPTLPNNNTQSTMKNPVIYTISLHKNNNNNNNITTCKPIKAITASNNTQPIIIPRTARQPIQTTSSPSQRNNTRLPKTVTASSLSPSQDLSYNNQYSPQLQTQMSESSPNVAVNENQKINSRENLNDNYLNDELYPTTTASNIVSGISSNVDDVEQYLQNIHDIYNIDYNNATSSSTEVDDLNILADDWNALLDNYHTDASLKDYDPSKIHGHELIPFRGSQSDVMDDNGALKREDQYHIDDLLQTPDIRPGMSSLSLDYMDDEHISWNKLIENWENNK